MSAGRSNILTKEELLRFHAQEKELESRAQEIKEYQAKINHYEQNFRYIGEHITEELQKRVTREEVKKLLEELSTQTNEEGEALDLLVTTTFDIIQEKENATEQALEDCQRENKALKVKIDSLKQQLREAEDTATELEQELGVGPLSQERTQKEGDNSGTNKGYQPRKLLFWNQGQAVNGSPRAKVEAPKTRQQDVTRAGKEQGSARDNLRTENQILKVRPKTNMADAHEKVMDLVTKYVPMFSGERSPKLAKEVHRFLSCSKDLHDRLETEERSIFIKCIKYRLTDDAYYLISSQEPKDFDSLQQAIKTAYMPRKSFSELRTEMLACRQRPGEDIREFADRMKELLDQIKAAVSAKYPGEDRGLIAELEADAVATFKAGVRNKSTQMSLTGRKFESLEKVREEATYFEKDAQRLQVREPGVFQEGRNLNTASPQNRWGMSDGTREGPRQLHRPFYPSTGPASSGRFQRPLARPTPPRPVECFQCGQKGHIARECRWGKRPPYCTKCRNYGHEASGCGKQQVRFADTAVGNLEINSTREVLYCQFCRTSDHYTANCLKKYLAEQGSSQQGNGERQLGNFSAAAFN